MISQLKGTVEALQDDAVLIDVSGVGYLLECSKFTLNSLPASGQATTILVETFVKDDRIKLFGFATDLEKRCFSLLLSVQSIGPRLAQTILSTISANNLIKAIGQEDKALLTNIRGVSSKIAGRILGELKDKIDKEAYGISNIKGEDSAAHDTLVQDARAALYTLGYSQNQSQRAVQQALGVLKNSDQPTPDLEQVIKIALREIRT